jgi:predicted helicase
MSDHDRERLRAIRTFPSLVKYLKDDLDWPITTEDFEELTFDYNAEELGIDTKSAAKIEEIKRLRPLSANQPWGIFFVKFEPKRLPVVALRRILSGVVVKKRATTRADEQAAWRMADLLFISNYGEGENRQITLAHFTQDEKQGGLPTLRVLGWDNLDTALHLDDVAEKLVRNLAWPENDADGEAWRERWAGAFTERHREAITTSKDLSVRLAKLARAIRDRLRTALAIETQNGPLTKLMKAFQEALVHDLDAEGFADMYAQTISYGLLSARIADPDSKTVDDFAGHMRTNPFLKELMETCLQVGGRQSRDGGPGIDFDELGVGEVVELLDDVNITAVVRDFGDRNPQEDPVIHFYELFLKEYDAKKRMQRGVFYTPRPVVSYIVRSVDELLRSEFGLADGLADITTWGEMTRSHGDITIPEGVSPEQDFVQILDPACGTGTFLVEVIDLTHKTMVAKWKALGRSEEIEALWNDYVPRHLLPRLHGYELLMAPYAIAHLKIGLKLRETGYHFGSDERARVYLTNALEPASDKQLTLDFLPALAHEAQSVNAVKRQKRFTVVIGNPPYSNFGQLNKIPFILELLKDYKQGLNEKKLNLDDDYLKFIRLGQYAITRSGRGVLGMITNSSFLDGVVHRKVRQSLLAQFSGGYIVDLHGNSRRGDTAPDGSPDKNVFDIQQGVAISVWARAESSGTSVLRYGELWGEREGKYEVLSTRTLLSTTFDGLDPRPEQFFFVPQDTSLRGEYETWVPLASVLTVLGSGLNTDRDDLCIDFDKASLTERMQRVFSGRMDNEFVETYNFRASSSYDPVALAKKQAFDPEALRICTYRPFDSRHIYYKVGFTSRPVFEVQGHMLLTNLGLLVCRQSKEPFAVLATRNISTHKIVAVYDRTSLAPLWLYRQEQKGQYAIAGGDCRLPSLAAPFLKELAGRLHLRVGDHGLPDGITPEDVFHFAYAVFYSPRYRSRYAEFLKTDFPRLPLPGNVTLFRELARLGGNLVALHLMESPTFDGLLGTYVGPQNPNVERVGWSNDTVWLDAVATKKGKPASAGTVGFRGVPEIVWDFHIGGYQVCEKWLKEREGRSLSDEDIAHYQKILVAISETIRLMQEIDDVIESHGGWPSAFQTAEGTKS